MCLSGSRTKIKVAKDFFESVVWKQNLNSRKILSSSVETRTQRKTQSRSAQDGEAATAVFIRTKHRSKSN